MRQDLDQAPIALRDLIDSYRVTAIIYVAARLGIADILTNGPKSSDELALEVGAHEPSLRRLLRALLTVGVCRSTHENQFELTEIGRHLADGANQSLKPWVLFEGGMCWRFWGTLLDSVRTGKTAPQLAGFDSVFDMMRESPENVATFNAAMAAFSGAVIPGVLAAYDFSGITRLIDVGGGHGQLLCAILKANPSLRGCVFDQPRCADGAKRRLVEAGVSERSEFVAGNFFEGIPDGADAVILKSVIHDWDDEKSAKILRNCRLALPAEGRLLLVERLMTAKPQVNNEDRSVVLSDLNMMLIPGGVERTEDEYRELLDSSGFKMTRTLPAGRVNVIECTLA